MAGDTIAGWHPGPWHCAEEITRGPSVATRLPTADFHWNTRYSAPATTLARNKGKGCEYSEFTAVSAVTHPRTITTLNAAMQFEIWCDLTWYVLNSRFNVFPKIDPRCGALHCFIVFLQFSEYVVRAVGIWILVTFSYFCQWSSWFNSLIDC